MTATRLYSRALGHSSHSQVSRGFREALAASNALAGEFALDVEQLPEDPARPGAGARFGVWTGPLAALQVMRQAGRHERRAVMVAPNSNLIPPNILRLLEAEATELLAPSSWAQGVLQELTDKVPVHLVRHGVHPEMGLDPAMNKNVHQAYDEGMFLIAHFSTSERQRKGTTELLEAWQMLLDAKALPDRAALGLVLDLPAYNKLVLDFDGQLPDRVVATHRLNLPAREMAGLLRAAHLVCQPSRGEAFGMIPLEALACGTPIAATACTGHSEYLSARPPGAVLVAHGDYAPIDDWEGSVAPAVSPSAIADAINDAYMHWIDLKDQAVSNAKRVQEEWSWQSVLREWIDNIKREAT